MYNLTSTSRLAALPTNIQFLIITRLASSASSSTQYPFPKSKRPSPHEIFHLRPGASQKEIKARYYELVRMHHPDSPHCRALPRHICHSQFQAITAAHDVLTGKARHKLLHPTHSGLGPSWRDDPADHAYSEFMRHRRSRAGNPHMHGYNAQWAHYAGTAEENADERWKDRVIMAVGIGTIAIAISPFISLIPGLSASDSKHISAAQNLAQARREAREFGELRRREIRKRVRVQELQPDFDKRKGDP